MGVPLPKSLDKKPKRVSGEVIKVYALHEDEFKDSTGFFRSLKLSKKPL